MTNPTVASAVRTGFRAFGLRLAALQAFRIISSVILARLLLPEDFAIFGALATLASFLQFVVDLGLAGALVQQPQAPDEDALAGAFTFQQAIAWLLVLALWVGAGPLTTALALPPAAKTMLRLYSLTLPLDAARLVPSVLLERQLRFTVFVAPEVLEAAAQYATQIALALRGLGAWALIVAGVVRGAAGTALLSRAAPWRPRWRWRPQVVRRAARFGVPFQLNAAVSAMRAFIPAWLVLALIGPDESGLVLWSLALAGLVWQLAFVANRVLFPAFARVAGEPAVAARAAGSLLLGGALGASAVAAVGSPLAPWAVPVIFGPRWLPAVPVLALLLWVTAAGVTSYLTGSILNGLGAPGTRLLVVIAGGLIELGLTLAWVPSGGAVAYARAALVAAVIEVAVALALVRRRLAFSLRPLLVVFAASAAGAALAPALGGPAVAAAASSTLLALAVALGAPGAWASLKHHAIG